MADKEKKKPATFTRTQFARAITPWAIIVISIAFFAGAYYGNWSTENSHNQVKAEAKALVSELKSQEQN